MLPRTPLNPMQHRAVHHERGPLLVLAGAGSGKTRVITHRVAELLRRGVPPARILAVTFTNKAAAEMRRRVEEMLGGPVPGLWLGTFHAMGARVLRIHAERASLPRDFLIFDDGDQITLVKQIIKELDLSDHIATPRSLLAAIDHAKNHGVCSDEYRGRDFFTDLVKRVYDLYQRRLSEAGAVDFGDLLLLPLKLCEKDSQVGAALAACFEHVLVDEFQDVNKVQYRLLCHLARARRQLFVVGDDDQAIYGWRGADVQNLLGFQRDWPDASLVKLEENYRSSQIILDAANAVIERNPDRHEKRLFTARQGGERILYHPAQDERDEALFIAHMIQDMVSRDGRTLSDFAIFYRTNAQSRVLEDALRMEGIPYTVIGGMRFYDRAEVKDVIAYLRLCHNPADEVALRRVVNVPPRGIGDGTIGKIEAAARRGGISMWQAMQNLLLSQEELGAGPRRKLQAFCELIEELRHKRMELRLDQLAEFVVDRTGYLLRLSTDDSPEAESRRENVMELLGSIREQAREAELGGIGLGLVDYLERVSLISSVDENARGVSLMTVHAAKGLEFDVVFVAGMEDGLFPSSRSMSDHADARDPAAEERRLAYVALTRARERLILTCARQRRLYGQIPHLTEPSRFLREIPMACLMQTRADGDRPAPVGRRDGCHVERDHEAHACPPDRRRREAVGARVPDGEELHIEYDMDQVYGEGAPFRLGQKVLHERFGEGEVRALSGSGRGLKLVVYFPGEGPRTVLARYLSPA